MPRTKSAAGEIAAPKRRAAAKRPVTKTIHPKKKTKSVLVDVIEDEPLNSDAAWLEPEDKMEKSELFNRSSDNNTAEEKSPRFSREDIDQQKKFFSGLAQEIKTKETSRDKNGEARSRRSVGLYRRLVVKFILLVAVLAVVVAYFSFTQLTVTLHLKGENINDNLLLKVTDTSATSTAPSASASSTSSALIASSDQNDPREPLSGTVKVIPVNLTKTYPASGETYIGEEIVGQVNIINNNSKDQALVVNTRLLSPDNKLFRIKNAVNVPAGGQVTVAIYSSNPSQAMAIGPTTFTIPGLWAGLQDKIYAQSNTAFIYQQKVKKYVNASDLDQAAQDINNSLMAAAKAQIASSSSPDTSWLYLQNDPATITMNAKIGAAQDQFSAQATGQIIAVSFDRNQAASFAQAKLNLLVPDDKELTDFNPADIIYSFDSYDPLTHTATIKATFTGAMILRSDSPVVNPEQLVNLTADQIGTYLNRQPEVQSYELKFFPSFIKRAPSLVDRIKIIISKN